MNPIQYCLNWFQKAVPEPTLKNQHVQLACHLEEVKEMLEDVKGGSEDVKNVVAKLRIVLNEAEITLKSERNLVPLVPKEKRANFQRELTDQIVTSIGLSHMFNMDPIAAMDEVNRANWSKFDSYGNPIFDQNGKIKKGPDFVPPNTEHCV